MRRQGDADIQARVGRPLGSWCGGHEARDQAGRLRAWNEMAVELHRGQGKMMVQRPQEGETGRVTHRKCHKVNGCILSDQRWSQEEEEKKVVAFCLHKIIFLYLKIFF